LAHARKGRNGMNIKPLHLEMDAELIAEVDDYRWRNRIASRKDAISQLIRAGLKTKPAKVEK